MNSSGKLSETTFAAALVIATTSPAAWAQYALTSAFVKPEPSLNNSLRDVALTDDFMFVGAAGFSRPGTQGQIFQFDVAGESLLRTIEDPLTRGFQSLTFGGGVAAEGRHVVATDTDISELPRYVHIFDAESGQLRHTLESPIPGHRSFASRVALGGDSVAVGAEAIRVGVFGPEYPARVFIFDALSGDLRHTLDPPDDIAVSDWGGMIDAWGDTIAVGSPRAGEAKVLLYDALTGQRVATIEHPLISGFDSLQLQGDKLLLGNVRGEAYLIDAAGNLLHTFESPGNDPEVSGAYFRFSGENVLIASFGSLNANTTVTPEAWLYDGTTGQLVHRFRDAAPADRFFSVASSPSGRQIAIVKRVDDPLHMEVLVYTKVPEPSSTILSALAAGGLVALRRGGAPRGIGGSRPVAARLASPPVRFRAGALRSVPARAAART